MVALEQVLVAVEIVDSNSHVVQVLLSIASLRHVDIDLRHHENHALLLRLVLQILLKELLYGFEVLGFWLLVSA